MEEIKLKPGRRSRRRSRSRMEDAKIIEGILKSMIHPLVVKAALYDRHVDNRLPILVEIERIFETK